MSADHADVALDSFLELEDRVRRFLQAVPLAPAHNRVHSPLLASILLDACSMLETTLKSSMDNARYNTIPGIAAIRAKRIATKPPYLNINDLRTVFYGDGFYHKQVWHLPSGDRSVPFHAWRPIHGNPPASHPSWWSAYNNVKHHRYDNATKATLKTTLHAVKGLFLALVQSLDFRRRFTERGIIRSALPTKTLLADVANWEPLPTASQDVVVATTRLFGYKFTAVGSKQRAQEISLFL